MARICSRLRTVTYHANLPNCFALDLHPIVLAHIHVPTSAAFMCLLLTSSYLLLILGLYGAQYFFAMSSDPETHEIYIGGTSRYRA